MPGRCSTIPARHDVARRVNAGYLAGLVAEHRMEEPEAAAIATDLAYHLARRAFRISTAMRSVVLVGLMGAGKSTAGSLVAAAIDRPFVDVDVAIVEQTGKTVRQLWEAGGEVAYRQLESRVVLDTLEGSSGVLAAPGGVVLDPAVRAGLVGSFVVWLRADPTTLANRVERHDHRPLLGDDPREILTKMALDRSELYGQVADLVVDSDRHDASAVAEIVLAALRTLPTDR